MHVDQQVSANGHPLRGSLSSSVAEHEKREERKEHEKQQHGKQQYEEDNESTRRTTSTRSTRSTRRTRHLKQQLNELDAKVAGAFALLLICSCSRSLPVCICS